MNTKEGNQVKYGQPKTSLRDLELISRKSAQNIQQKIIVPSSSIPISKLE
jgi:hypothetical protein